MTDSQTTPSQTPEPIYPNPQSFYAPNFVVEFSLPSTPDFCTPIAWFGSEIDAAAFAAQCNRDVAGAPSRITYSVRPLVVVPVPIF